MPDTLNLDGKLMLLLGTTGSDSNRQPGTNFTSTIHKDTYLFIDSSKQDLSGKNVFIAGASKGIGRAITIAYARAGASSIAIGARSDLDDLAQEIAEVSSKLGKPSPKVVTVKLDVSDQASVAAAAKEVEIGLGGRLDILICNAGVIETPKPITESDPDEWWWTYTVNVRGPYLVTRAFLPMMLAQGDKQIVMVGSIGAHWIMSGLSAYQPGKLAVLRFSEFVTEEYGDKGILSYTIHPGNVATTITDHHGIDYGDFFDDTPELAADTLVYLTKERREWLAGRYVAVAWDMEEFLGKKDDIVTRDLLKVRMRV